MGVTRERSSRGKRQERWILWYLFGNVFVLFISPWQIAWDLLCSLLTCKPCPVLCVICIFCLFVCIRISEKSIAARKHNLIKSYHFFGSRLPCLQTWQMWHQITFLQLPQHPSRHCGIYICMVLGLEGEPAELLSSEEETLYWPAETISAAQ